MKNPLITFFLALTAFTLLGYSFANVEKMDTSPKGVFNAAWRMVKNNYVDETCNHQDWEKWKKRYENSIETYRDSHVAIETMLESLDDPYTKFLSVRDFKEQDMNMDARLKGIGVHITKTDGKVIIISVIENSPARKYGLKPKDEIIKVDSTPTKGLPLGKVADLIRGEEGSSVKITVLRDDNLLDKSIIREEIRIKTVKYKMLDKNIAYIKISSFISFDTTNEFKNALRAVNDAHSLIIDVRGNYGGLLTNAIEVTNAFLDKGNIVSIVDRAGNKKNFSAKPYNFVTHKPVIVLIDEASASASEIFSGALQDYERAELVGEKTFGKGKVQMVLRLPDDSGINLTIAKYLTPSGRDIEQKGIEPDYKVPTSPEGFIKGEDVCLSKAVEILSSKKLQATLPPG